ncbi:MAG TPA: glycosyltransferase family 2 protein [Vitreimonas sp.]|nr:glycosyltransferase family 2 protein [Vitreimonas sp.]
MTSHLLPVTVVVITDRNDERLQRCLASVSWAKEVLVEDYSGQKITDFSLVRNLVLQKVSQPWILFLDSDEWLEDKAATEIAHAITQPCQGFYLQRKDIFLNKVMNWGEVRNVWLLRLARRGAIHFKRAVHEVPQVGPATARLESLIYHHSHLSQTDFMSKVSYYASLEAKQRPPLSKSSLLLQLLFFPPGKLLYNLFIKLGFLDGWRGIVYIWMMSLHSLLVRVYQYENKTVAK